jgi:WD40 repeat protein
MQQWLGLFVKVTKPVLTTLVYSSINSWIEAFQEEIKDRQKQKAKLVLDSLSINEENEAIVQKKQVTATTTKKLPIPETKKYSQLWPLRISSQELLQSFSCYNSNSLRIFFAPPKKKLADYFNLSRETIDIEQRMSQSLQEFLKKNYSLHSPSKATEFLSGLWDNSNFHGEASIKALFNVFKSLPTVILQTEIEGNQIVFYLAYWGKNTRKYSYDKIFQFNYQTFLEESVKGRVLDWKNIRHQLENLGKSREDIQRLGGNCELNLPIVEEKEILQAAGIETEKLTFPYQFNEQDLDYLCQFLTICHCLVTGWVADIHYLVNDDISPHLADWLPTLGDLFSENSSSFLDAQESDFQSQQVIFQATVSIYQDVLTVLANESSQDIPELALKLAESLIHLPDSTYAIAQIEYSFECWCQQRQVSLSETIETLETIYSSLSQKDWQYLAKLHSCLSTFTEEQQIIPIRKVVDALNKKIVTSSNIPMRERTSFQLHHSVTTVGEKIFSLNIDPDGNQLISQRQNNSLKLWYLDPHNGHLSLSQELVGHSGKIISVDLCDQGKLLASSDTSEQRSYIKIWHLPTGKLMRTLFGHKQPIHALAINPGHPSFLASGSHKIKLWNLQTGESWLTLFGHKEKVCCLSISHNGKTLISGSEDKTIRVWDLKTGELLQTLKGHQSSVNKIVLSTDGETLISGSKDQTIKVWELKKGNLLHTLKGHSATLQALTLSSHSRYLLSGCEAGIVNLWDLQAGKILQTLNGHNQAIRVLAFSYDEQMLASGCDAGILKLWKSL